MKILMVEPGKIPCEEEIESGLNALQSAVGGDIQAIYPYEDPVALICNDEGKLLGLPLNRALKGEEGNIYDIVAGNFLIVGLGEDNFTNLSPELMEKFREQFLYPEKFVRIAGEIVAVKQPLPPADPEQSDFSYKKAQESNTYTIYQLAHTDDTAPFRFMSYDWLEHKGLTADCDNYQLIYSAKLAPGRTLDSIYEEFNLNHPKDFKGHSLSVSDVVVLHENGEDTAFYVDSIGFRKLPDFLDKAMQPGSMREQLDNARKQAAQAAPKTENTKNRETERS